jgi:FAD/FMN-containing dehydrogenase
MDPAADLAAFGRSLRGSLATPSDPLYDDLRRSFNGMIDRRPAGIVRPSDTDDIRRTLELVRRHGLPLGVRGGRHSVAGHGLVDDGIVIDLRDHRTVQVDPEGRRATAGAGCTWLDLDTATIAHGLAVPGGTYGDTGIGGLTLGGGIGFLMGVAGFTCDNLIGVQMVTAEGRVAEVSAETDPDLLWALRGGGGNFGIVTRFDYALHPMGPMYGGEFVVRIERLGELLARSFEAMADAPDAFLPMWWLTKTTDIGFGGEIQVAFAGPPAGGEPYVRRMLRGIEAAFDDLGPREYPEIQAMNGELAFGLRHYWKSTFTGPLGPDAQAALLDALSRRPDVGRGGILIEPIHGAARRIPREHAALAIRDARFHVTAIAIWDQLADDAAWIAWARATAQAMEPWSMGMSYVNYLAADDPDVKARVGYGSSFERLQQVKGRVDPDNLFRSNLNITPA